jgi:hypothetical protein
MMKHLDCPNESGSGHERYFIDYQGEFLNIPYLWHSGYLENVVEY